MSDKEKNMDELIAQYWTWFSYDGAFGNVGVKFSGNSVICK